MKNADTSNRHLLKTGERILGHALAIVLGSLMMIAGAGLGVTMVALPVGLPLGLAGLVLFLWGLYRSTPSTRTRRD
jgi:hypothetical protein